MTKASVTRKVVLVLAIVLVMQILIGATASAAPNNCCGGCFYHTVAWGQSLSSIACAYGDNVWNLAARNGIANPNYIRAGQVLYVCGCGGCGVPAPAPVGYHTVQWGETLSSIAWRYGTTVWSIASLNGLANVNYIYAGQVLRIW